MKKVTKVLAVFALILLLVSCSTGIKEKSPDSTPPVLTEKEQESPELPVQEHLKEVEGDPELVENEDKDKDETAEEENPPEEVDSSTLSNEKITSWMPARNKEHKVPVLNSKYKALLDKYGGYFVGDTSSKVIYLTFDEGYEYGLTGRILDILKANDVKAAFFATASYIKKNPDLIQRMVDEGHIVGNHTRSHPIMPDLLASKGKDAVIKELTDTEDAYREVTGTEMPKYYRPPEGAWSEATLSITNSMGYKTILWSMAHRDWDPNNQPGKKAAFDFVNTYYHNGAILLLHPQSQSNTDALQDIITNLKNNGYRFAPLSELK